MAFNVQSTVYTGTPHHVALGSTSTTTFICLRKNFIKKQDFTLSLNRNKLPCISLHFSNSLSFNDTNLSILCSKIRYFCCSHYYILFVKYFQLCKSLCLLRVAPLGRAWWRPTVAIPTYWRTVRRKAYPHPLYGGTRMDSHWTSVPANP